MVSLNRHNQAHIIGRVIGLPVTAGSAKNVSQAIFKKAQDGGQGYVCVGNVHMLITAKGDDKLRRVMENAFMVTTDGLPLVWMLKHRGFKDAERLTGTDLTITICEMAEKERLPVSFYGGTPDTIRSLQSIIKKRFPDLIVADYESPPRLPDQPAVDQSVVKRINATGTRIVFVGLGCPKQEFWMVAYTNHVNAVLIGVGAAFDFIAGTVKRAPSWIQKSGLEWLHRLVSDPKRLWKRYAITNTLFIWFAFKEFVNLKSKQSDMQI